MAGNKTRDGIKLATIVKMAEDIGIEVRAGSKHPYVLQYEGMRSSPLATSTDVKKMTTPWISEALGMAKQEVYRSLRQGYWAQA